MSNHLHAVLRLRPDVTRQWSAAEVVERWWKAYPPQRLRDGTPVAPTAAQISAQVADAGWVALRRERRGNLGWLMKSLKEDLSRRANCEDGCAWLHRGVLGGTIHQRAAARQRGD